MLQTIQIFAIKNGLFPLIFFIGIIGIVYIGFWIGKFRLKIVIKNEKPVINSDFVNAIFGLAALLIAFNFSIAVGHFGERQTVTLKEVSAISSSYEAAELLNRDDRLTLQGSIIDYLDNRITFYDNWESVKTLNLRVNQQKKHLTKIKFQAIQAVANVPLRTRELASKSILSSIEKMNESFENQVILMKNHPPLLLMRSLTILIVIVSFLSGYSMAIKKEHDWVLALLFALIMMGTIYVILHLEYPNIGSLHLDDSKIQLNELRKSL